MLNKSTHRYTVDTDRDNERLDVIDAENGLISYDLKDKVKHAGWLKAKLILKKDDESIHVIDFKMEIIDSGIESSVAKEVDVDILMEAFDRFVAKYPEKVKGDGPPAEDVAKLLEPSISKQVFEEFDQLS